MRLGRNDPCSCGSGKKYKNCCLNKTGSPAPHSSGPAPEDIDLLGTLFNTGHYEELENLARSLLKLYPDSGVVWKLFGLSLQMRGKDALHALKKAADLLPKDAEAHGNLAAALRAGGRLEEAVVSGRRALQIKPDFAGGHNNLGVALQDLGRLAEAAASYRRALEIKPDFVEAYNNLGGVLKEQGLIEEALESYRRALQIKPDFSRAHSNMGVIMRELGQPEEELECYRLALESDPMCSEAMLGLGQLCLASGEIAEAEGLFRKALEIKPDDVETRFLLTQVGKVKAGDENLAALAAMKDAALRSPSSIPYKKSILLNFALGKCLDDLGEPDRAFPHFLEGCKLKRATVEYDAGQTTQHFDDIIRVFDAATMQRLHGGGDPSALPIFVLGMPRSGTTLTEQIIASHPDVHGAGELPDLLAIVNRQVAGSGAVFPGNIAGLDQAGLGAWGADYVAALQRRAPEAGRITDKMPSNFMAIGLIHLMLPNAKIVHVIRNPVDTCLSCFMQLFSYRQEQSYDLAEIGQYYVDYARLMAHWRSVLPAGAFLEVRYEDIVADQENQARRMIAYCGLDWDDACIDFHNSKRSVRTASVTQVRQPVYRSSVERWRKYERFLGPLLDALGDLAPGRTGSPGN